MRPFLLYWALILWPAFCYGAQKNVRVNGRAVVAALAQPGMPGAPTAFSAPGPALALLPKGTNPGLNPAVAASMSNPVPATALGMSPLYFTATQITAAAGPRSAVPVEAAAGTAYDGSRGRPTAAEPASSIAAPAAEPRSRADYLRQVRGLRGHALFTALRGIMEPRHKLKDYDEAKQMLFLHFDRTTVGGRGGVRDGYSRVFVPGTGGDGAAYVGRGVPRGDGVDRRGMGPEHIWPRSFSGSAPRELRADVNNLMPTFSLTNEQRGNRPFGTVKGPYAEAAGLKIGRSKVEPTEDEVKGVVARRLLGVYLLYRDNGITAASDAKAFWLSQVDELLEWNRRYPPQAWERLRNDDQERFQGDRNPFVDDPSLADRIGADVLKR